MEAFLLAVAIVTVLALLLATQRFNRNIARYMPVEAKEYLYLANTAGKWLAMAGGLATAPLVMVLTFVSYGSPDWIITLGASGLVALLAASLMLGAVFFKNCTARKLKAGRVLLTATQQLLAKVKAFYQIKTVSRITRAAILIVLLPFIVNALAPLLLVAGFIMAARFGLLDNVGETEDFNGTDYIQEGIDYDFFYGTNEYDSFPSK